jgi:hypothetical protein
VGGARPVAGRHWSASRGVGIVDFDVIERMVSKIRLIPLKPDRRSLEANGRRVATATDEIRSGEYIIGAATSRVRPNVADVEAL